jgi:hypothetical protein
VIDMILGSARQALVGAFGGAFREIPMGNTRVPPRFYGRAEASASGASLPSRPADRVVVI